MRQQEVEVIKLMLVLLLEFLIEIYHHLKNMRILMIYYGM